jgi:hypothetical protein
MGHDRIQGVNEMSIQKKSLTGVANPKTKQGDSGRKVSGKQPDKSAETSKLKIAKLATAKLSTAKLVTLKKLS